MSWRPDPVQQFEGRIGSPSPHTLGTSPSAQPGVGGAQLQAGADRWRWYAAWFVVWLVLYSLTARHLAPICFLHNDAIYSADTRDNFKAMNHYTLVTDSRKHLLFSAATVPLVRTLLAVGVQSFHAMYIVMGFLAALNITLALLNFTRLVVDPVAALWAGAVYGLAFSNLVIFSVPETYSVSGIMIQVYLFALLRSGSLAPHRRSALLGFLSGLAALFNPVLLSLGAFHLLPGTWQDLKRPRYYAGATLAVAVALTTFVIPNLAAFGSGFLQYNVKYVGKFSSLRNFGSFQAVSTVFASFTLFTLIAPVRRLTLLLPVSEFWRLFQSARGVTLLAIYSGTVVSGLRFWRKRLAFEYRAAIWCAVLLVFYIYFNPREAILYSTQVLFPIVLFLALTSERVPRPLARVMMATFLLLLAVNNLNVIRHTTV